jgi:hypothetical protein
MTQEEFVVFVEDTVAKVALRNTISLLKAVPGQAPRGTLVELSKWFNQLEPPDQKRVEAAMAEAIFGALFRWFVILDETGSSAPRRFVLTCQEGNHSFVINENSELHELITLDWYKD